MNAADWRGIRAAHEVWQHSIEPINGGWQARNAAQQWTTTFDGRGFEAKPQSADWTWGLELRSYGAGGEQRAVNGKPAVKTEGHRLAYYWDDTVQEWFVNDGRGLEHGFSVQERPPGPVDVLLRFVLATRGPLRAAVTGDARAVDYRDESGATVLTYSGLRVWDAEGRELEARFAPAEDGVTLQVDAADARYPLTIDPIAQQAYLKEPGVATPDAFFGHAVAVSGDTAVVGAPFSKTPPSGVIGGVAHVYVRNGSTWTHQAVLTPSDPAENDLFGMSVAISDDTVIVGAPQRDGPNGENGGSDENCGAAYVFFRNGSVWSRQAELVPSDADTLEKGALFGASVSVSDNTAVVGAPRIFNAVDVLAAGFPALATTTAAYVFVRAGTAWTEQARLPNPTGRPLAGFGESVCIEGETLVVGAPRENKGSNPGSSSIGGALDFLLTGAGAAHVFVRSGQAWNLQATLLDPNPVPVVGNSGALFGTSVSLSGETLVVGARGVDFPNTGGIKDGAAYVFTRSGSAWQQQARLVASNFEGLDEFGAAVAISGDIIVVGARGEDGLTSGIDSTPNDPLNFNQQRDAGAAYLFARSGTAWTQRSYIKASNAEPEDAFGFSVAISADTWLVGAPQEDSNGTSPTNNTAVNAGAAYAFVGPEPVVTSATSATGQVSSGFRYQITTMGGTPTSYGATGLPAGLSINTSTGAIAGVPTEAGPFSVALSAANLGGTDVLTLDLAIAKCFQRVVFPRPRDRSFRRGARFRLAATATSLLPVTFTSSNPRIVSVNGRTATIRGRGRVTITARQAGNDVHLAAAPVRRIVVIR